MGVGVTAGTTNHGFEGLANTNLWQNMEPSTSSVTGSLQGSPHSAHAIKAMDVLCVCVCVCSDAKKNASKKEICEKNKKQKSMRLVRLLLYGQAQRWYSTRTAAVAGAFLSINITAIHVECIELLLDTTATQG